MIALLLALCLTDAIIEVESGGDDNAVGDGGKAISALQIHEICFNDVKDHDDLKGYVYRDVVDRKVALIVFRLYIAKYCTEKRLGRKPTNEDKARIWNGGPNGHLKSATVKYWALVKKAMEK